MVNPVIEQATRTIATAEVDAVLKGVRCSREARQELIDRLIVAIDLAVQDEVEAIERDVQAVQA